MSLEKYWGKRNFDRTNEPMGEVRAKVGNIYVIQKHDASHLHYDLRLERDGVLRSWAVPKQPPTQKGMKRLAVETEDHPIGYADFEGVIPEGEYGAGTVEIWDKGTYETEKWREDEIIIHINGTKLNGRYCLIKFKKQENAWLFFKC
jgi:DNA ligase D-like protein (predicted 3'-phosphoesterase)